MGQFDPDLVKLEIKRGGSDRIKYDIRNERLVKNFYEHHNSKEIVLQNARNTPKKAYIKVLLGKYFINIRTSTSKASGKPSNSTSLFIKDIFHKFS